MSSNDATLLGRQTYDEFAGYWPNADPGDPMTGMMNGARKYVVSDSLTEATWANSSVISGDVKVELTRLKADTGLGTTSSATLVRWMLEHGLVDELHLSGRRPRHRRGARPGRFLRGHSEVASGRHARQPGGLAAVLEVTGEVFDVDAADVEQPMWCCQHQRANWRRSHVEASPA